MELTMRKYIATITEEDIRSGIEAAATELEEENQVHFPDREARVDFVEDCVSGIIDKIDLYERDPFMYRPDYTMEVLDTAKVYGCLL